MLRLTLHACLLATAALAAPAPDTGVADTDAGPRPVRFAYSLGDSYSANPGAGKQVADDPHCHRFTHSWPLQFQDNFGFVSGFSNPSAGSNLETISCTGALLDDVSNQIDQIAHQSEVITLTAGGNDLGFSGIVQNCIYALNKNPKDKCDDALDDANDLLRKDIIQSRAVELLQKLRNTRENSNIYWLGYVEFFEEVSNNITAVLEHQEAGIYR